MQQHRARLREAHQVNLPVAPGATLVDGCRAGRERLHACQQGTLGLASTALAPFGPLLAQIRLELLVLPGFAVNEAVQGLVAQPRFGMFEAPASSNLLGA